MIDEQFEHYLRDNPGYMYITAGDGRVIAVEDSDDYFKSLKISDNIILSSSYRFVYDAKNRKAYFISFAPDTYTFMYEGKEWSDLHTERADLSDRIEITITALNGIIASIDSLLALIKLEENKAFKEYEYEYKFLKQDILNALTAFEYYIKHSPLNYDFMYYTMNHIIELYSHKDYVPYHESTHIKMVPIHSFDSFEEIEDYKGTPEEKIQAIHKYLHRDKTMDEFKPDFYKPVEYFEHYQRYRLNREYVGFYSIDNDLQMLLSILDFCCMHRLPLRRCKVCGKYFIGNSEYKSYCSAKCKIMGADIKKAESAEKRKMSRDAVKRTTNSFKNRRSKFPIESLHIPDDADKALVQAFKHAIVTGDREAFSDARAKLFEHQYKKAETGKMTQEELSEWFESFGRLR